MSHTDNAASLDSLANDLTQDFDQHQDTERNNARAELEAFVASVPPRAEFSNGRNYLYVGIIAAAILFLIVGWAYTSGLAAEYEGLIWTLSGLGVIGLLMAWQHRNAGKHAHMVMTHDELIVSNLSGPVRLVDVVDLDINDYQQTEIIFTMQPDAQLPTSKARRGFYPSQGVVKRARKNKPPRVLVYSGGHTVNGRKASVEEVADTISTYLSVAQARAQLAAMHAGTPPV